MSPRVRYRQAHLNGNAVASGYRRPRARPTRTLTSAERTEECASCGLKSSVIGMRTHAAHGCLPAGPLLTLVALHGGPTACGVWCDEALAQAYARARSTGRLTYRAADNLSIELLGLTMWEIWGDAVT